MEIPARTKPHYGSVKLNRIWCVAKDREMGVIPEIPTKLDLSHRAVAFHAPPCWT